MKNCPICSKRLKHKTSPTVYNYKNESITINQPGCYCDNCDEEYLSPSDLKSTKKEIADFKRRVDHLLTTDELKSIRKKLKLTQEQAAELFGGGVRAFHKYETAEATQSKPLDILLRLVASKKISLDDVKSICVATNKIQH
ncbi:MAG: type II toxin-antitoxin system MqsA family antitoxin [Campylobacterales bacterium]